VTEKWNNEMANETIEQLCIFAYPNMQILRKEVVYE